MKIKVQAQHMQPGDITTGSGERVMQIVVNSTTIPSNKVRVYLDKAGNKRCVIWGKYTQISVERA